MKYHQPFDQPYSPNAGYLNGNPSTGVQGSIPPAEMMEYTQREIVNVIAASGQTPDDGDLFQMLRAVRGGLLDYFVDNGSANAVAIAPSPAYVALAPGNKFRVKLANTFTGDATLQVNGVIVPIRVSGGASLQGGEASAGDIVSLEYDGTYAQLRGASGSSGQLITNNVTMSVPSQYPTIRAAVLRASTLIIASNVYVTIQVAAGYVENLTSVTGPIYLSHPCGQRLKIVGAPLNGAFPTASDIGAMSNADTLTLLKSRFRVVVNAVGVNAWELHAGALNSVENILTVGDGNASGGHYGTLIGSWSTEVGMGTIGFKNCWFHGFGLDNVRAEQSSVIQANNLGSTYATAHGFHISHYSVLECNFGNLLAMHNQTGIALQNYGLCAIDSASGTIDVSYNQDGVASPSMGEFMGVPSTGLRVQNNTRYGFYMSLFSSVGLSVTGNTTFSGNGSADISCNLTTTIATFGCSLPSGSSPARGAGAGNYQSYVL